MSTRGLQPKRIASITAAMVFVLAACGDDGGDSDDESTDEETQEEEAEAPVEMEAAAEETCAVDDVSYVATADVEEGGQVAVYDEPDGEEITSLDAVWEADEEGNQTPTTFLVDQEGTDGDPFGADWLSVDLPVPEGDDGTGYVEATDVGVSCHAYRVTIDRESFTLNVTEEGEQVFETTVALGSDDRATQEGNFFITDLTRTTNPAGDYGPYAFALNSYSEDPEVIADFGENARAGIHGTNEPDKLGTAVSSGCIRMENSAIARLANDPEHMEEGAEAVPLPLGTPVEVV